MTFEEWWGKRVVVGNDNDKDTCRQVWEAATAAERERCAKVCEAMARRWRWQLAIEPRVANLCAALCRSDPTMTKMRTQGENIEYRDERKTGEAHLVERCER